MAIDIFFGAELILMNGEQCVRRVLLICGFNWINMSSSVERGALLYEFV